MISDVEKGDNLMLTKLTLVATLVDTCANGQLKQAHQTGEGSEQQQGL